MMHILRAVSDSPKELRSVLKYTELITLLPDGSWTLSKNGIKLKKQEGEVNTPGKNEEHIETSELNWADFRQLIRYYIKCLEVESPRNYFLKPEKYGKDYCIPKSLRPFWLRGLEEACKPHFLQFDSSELPMMAATMDRTTPDGEVCLGYPVLTFFNDDRKVETYVPLALVPIKYVCNDTAPQAFKTNTIEVEFTFNEAMLNQKWVDYCVPKEYHQELFFALDNLNDDGNFDLKRALPLVLGYSSFTDFTYEPDSLFQYLPVQGRKRREMCNTAMIFRISENKYTKNLMRELQDLLVVPVEDLDRTSLAYIYRNPPLKSFETIYKVAIPFINSNSEQLTAVEDSLNHPVVQLQGPPGTGKSQVAVNLIANCIYHGDSVLFSSKNHNAVDAIKDRAKTVVEGYSNLVQFCIEGDDRLSWFRNDYTLNKAELTELMTSEKKRRKIEVGAKASDIHRIEELYRQETQYSEQFLQSLDSFEDAKDTAHGQLYKFGCEIDGFDIVPLLSKMRLLLGFRRTDFLGFLYRLFHSKNSQKKIKKVLDGYGRLRSCYEEETPENFKRIINEIENAMLYSQHKQEVLDKSFQAYLDHAVKDGETLITERNAAMEVLEQHGVDALISVWNERIERLSDKDHDDIDRVRQRCISVGGRSPWDEITAAERLVLKQGMKKQHIIQPAWATTLLSAWLASPMLPGVFDQVIIDEASQCDVISIVPMLFRAKRAILIGDPEQFRPIINIPEKGHARIWNKMFQGDDRLSRFAFFKNSAYDVLKRVTNQLMLKEHFRCDSSIAGYFNDVFYRGELRIRTNEKPLDFPECFGDRSSFRWIEISDSMQGEMDAAIHCFETIKNSGYTGTVGIICPLRDVVEEVTLRLQALGYDKDDVTVQTAYGFQGGQRDVIIFVVAYNSDIGEKKNWYVSNRENRNIYNVTVSRARACLVVVGDRERIRSAEMLELRTLASYPKKRLTAVKFDSVWEEKLFNALLEKGIPTETQRYCIGYYLDLSYENSYIKLDIEVDGVAYHLGANGKRKQRDIERNFALQRFGWTVLRFWVYELTNDMESCVEKIVATIQGVEAKAKRAN